MVNEKALAIDLYLLPERQRIRLLSSIPSEFLERLNRYFQIFELHGSEKEDVSAEEFSPDYRRTENLVRLMPGASAAFVGHLAKVIDGEVGEFPSSLARALRDYVAAGEIHE